MFDKKNFFDTLRKRLMGPVLTNQEVKGTEFLLDGLSTCSMPRNFAAYILATAWHETQHEMRPVKEKGSENYLRRMYDITGARPDLARKNGNTVKGDGIRYSGRGYVQITWKNNYRDVGSKLRIDLLNFPDKALEPEIARRILIEGMTNGWFTGKKLGDYLPLAGNPTERQYATARKTVNGVDKAKLIATYAMEFYWALFASGWEY